MEEKEIYLVSPEFIKRNTNLSSNIQDKFLLSAIREASDIDYQEMVGTALYERLKALVGNDEIANEEYVHYRQLLEISKYFLSYSVMSRVCVIASVKIDNIGANQTSDERVQPLGMKDVFTMENYYHNKADFYKKRVQSYLLNNKDYLKELEECKCNDIRANLRSASHCNIWLGGARSKIKR